MHFSQSRFSQFSVFILILPLFSSTLAGEWNSQIDLEYRAFPNQPDASTFVDTSTLPDFIQDEIEATEESATTSNNSVAIKTEYYTNWNNGDTSLLFVPFARFDETDEDRSHYDIRELSMLHLTGDWEYRAGISKVFWGVAESQHLVDIINQTDLAEDIDGEEKLGQPMLRATWLQNWGIADFFILPLHRPLYFPGEEGRPGYGVPFNDSEIIYEAEEGENHIDLAARVTQQFDDFEYSLSYFNGTSRNPRFTVDTVVTDFESSTNQEYDLIEQVGLEFLYLLGDFTVKLEMINRSSDFETYSAAVGGFEYTYTGIFGSNADTNWFLEYNWDEREEDASSQYQDDIFYGLRIGLNDEASSELRGGLLHDQTYGSKVFRLEGSRRLSPSWTGTLLYQGFTDIADEDILAPLQNDDYLEAEVTYYF